MITQKAKSIKHKPQKRENKSVEICLGNNRNFLQYKKAFRDYCLDYKYDNIY